MWDWQSQEFDLQKDLVPGLQHDHSFCPKTASSKLLRISSDLAAPSSSLWAETNHNVIDSWGIFDEQTPIKECTDIELPLCDIGGKIVLFTYISWLPSPVAYYTIREGCRASVKSLVCCTTQILN
jgi:hypothetical protein